MFNGLTPVIVTQLTTRQLALAIGRSDRHILNIHSQTGSFWGVRPQRGPTGRLLWPMEPFKSYMLTRVDLVQAEPDASVRKSRELKFTSI